MPVQSFLVSNYFISSFFKINNSSLGLIVSEIFYPLGIFILIIFLQNIPKENFEASQIDGAKEWQIFIYIIFPQLKSGISALIFLNFIKYWNITEQAIIFISDPYKQPLSISLSRLSKNNIGIIFAASSVYMFVPLLLFLFIKDDLKPEIELSGIKF